MSDQLVMVALLESCIDEWQTHVLRCKPVDPGMLGTDPPMLRRTRFVRVVYPGYARLDAVPCSLVGGWWCVA